MHKGKVIAKKGKYKIIDCEICGFKHLDPIPSKEEVEEHIKNQTGMDLLLEDLSHLLQIFDSL